MAAQTGFLRCGVIMRLSCRLKTHPSAAARASVTCQPKLRMAGVTVGELDAARLSRTSWDMIQKVRRPDQARSEATDARRTECGFHAARKGETAGQRLFRWVGIGGL